MPLFCATIALVLPLRHRRKLRIPARSESHESQNSLPAVGDEKFYDKLVCLEEETMKSQQTNKPLYCTSQSRCWSQRHKKRQTELAVPSLFSLFSLVSELSVPFSQWVLRSMIRRILIRVFYFRRIRRFWRMGQTFTTSRYKFAVTRSQPRPSKFTTLESRVPGSRNTELK